MPSFMRGSHGAFLRAERLSAGAVAAQSKSPHDENGGFGLNNGQETPTGRPLSLSRVKAEVRLLRGLLYLHRNPGNKRIGTIIGTYPMTV